MRFTSARETPVIRRLLLFASRWTPELNRVLLIESGSRVAAERFLNQLYGVPQNCRVDVLTCYETAPATFDNTKGDVIFTSQLRTKSERARMLRTLASSEYSAVCLLCTRDPIMTKWKWAAALRIPAKVMIVNENADTFWLDRGHVSHVKRMFVDRRGARHPAHNLFRTLGDVLLFPVTLGILLGFAGYMKGKSILRTHKR